MLLSTRISPNFNPYHNPRFDQRLLLWLRIYPLVPEITFDWLQSYLVHHDYDYKARDYIQLLKFTANHEKGNSCSIRYLSWKKWVFGIFFLRYGKSVIKWSQCHESHEIISISKDFIVKRRYGIRICVWTVNFSKDIKKGIFFIWFLSFAVQEINWYHRPFERYLKELSFAANLTFLAQFV